MIGNYHVRFGNEWVINERRIYIQYLYCCCLLPATKFNNKQGYNRILML